MAKAIKLTRVESHFANLSYPLDRETAADAFEDVTVVLADGEAPLGDLIAQVHASRFLGPDDLYAELQNVVPLAAVGEPGQSDGDA